MSVTFFSFEFGEILLQDFAEASFLLGTNFAAYAPFIVSKKVFVLIELGFRAIDPSWKRPILSCVYPCIRSPFLLFRIPRAPFTPEIRLNHDFPAINFLTCSS